MEVSLKRPFSGAKLAEYLLMGKTRVSLKRTLVLWQNFNFLINLQLLHLLPAVPGAWRCPVADLPAVAQRGEKPGPGEAAFLAEGQLLLPSAWPALS